MTQYKSAREMAEAISRGEIPHQYLGDHTKATLTQSLFSLKNEYKPQTMLPKELDEWNGKVAGILDAVKGLSEQDQKEIRDNVDKLLDPNGENQ